MSRTEPPGIGRRALLRGAGGAVMGASALTALSGCGGKSASGALAPTQVGQAAIDTDLRILTAALALERRTVTAYIAAIPLLPHSLVKGAKAFLSEELAHTGELISLIKGAGGRLQTGPIATTSAPRRGAPPTWWPSCTRSSASRSPAT